MNKKRGIVIAVVLFLFLGTSTFVFANPSQDEIKGTRTKDEQKTNKTDSDKPSNENTTNPGEINPPEGTEDDILKPNETDTDNNGENIIINQTKPNRPNNNGTTNNNPNNNQNQNNSNNNNNTQVPDNNEENPTKPESPDLNEENKIKDAEEALDKAENNLTQENINDAQDKINQITDPDKKQELQDKLDELQNKLDEENKIKDAEEALDKAENNLTQENIDKAQDKINQVTDSDKKQELQDKLDELQNKLDEENKIKDAEQAIEDAKNNLTQDNLDNAQDKINQITDPDKKQELQDKLDELQNKLDEENKIKDAENALDNAENNLTQDNLDDAQDKINQVTDPNKKQELQDKLDELQNNFIIKKLVQTLEEKVTNATNKAEIDGARDYRTNNQITDKVNALENEELKNELTLILNELAKILDDTISPIIEGIENNAYVNTAVSISIKDQNEFKIYLNNEEVTQDNLSNITEDKVYNLVVIDKAFNQTEIQFTIDTQAPIIEGIENNTTYEENVTITVSNETQEVIVYLTKDGENIPYTLGTELSENGTYTIYALDKAHNKSEEITFTIDKNEDEPFVFEDMTFFTTDHISVKNTAYSWMKIYSPYESTDFVKEYTVTYSTVYKIELYDEDKNLVNTVNMVYNKEEKSILKNTMKAFNMR